MSCCDERFEASDIVYPMNDSVQEAVAPLKHRSSPRLIDIVIRYLGECE